MRTLNWKLVINVMKVMFKTEKHNIICFCQSWGECPNSPGLVKFHHLLQSSHLPISPVLQLPTAALHTGIGCSTQPWFGWDAELQQEPTLLLSSWVSVGQARIALLWPSPQGLRVVTSPGDHPNVYQKCCTSVKLLLLCSKF